MRPTHLERGLYLLTNLNKDLRHLQWDVGRRHDGFGLSGTFQQCFHSNEAVVGDTKGVVVVMQAENLLVN